MSKITSINPFTNAEIQQFESFTPELIELAIENAKTAQKKWSTADIAEKTKLFENLKEILTNNIDTIAEVVKNETGKIRPDFEAEIYDVIVAVDYYLQKYSEVTRDTSVKPNATAFPSTDIEIAYVPYGVVALIMPWNFPFYSPFMYVITSLMTGNAVLLKPSEYATMVGYEIERVVKEAGFPKDIIQIVLGDEETGKALVKSDVDKIFFVGSVEAGKDIMQNAGIKSLQFELGGNSAGIVLEDANIDLAVQGLVWGATYHSGQDCVGIKRVFVHESIATNFIKKAVELVKKLEPEKDYGPYITIAARDEVKKRIDDAVEQGAQIIYGGLIPNEEELVNGNWLTPTIIRVDDSNIELVQKETFGNIMPIMTFETIDELVEKVNATEYGLSNSVFTSDLTLSSELADKLQSGMVFINDPFIAIPGWDHWTGWKDSGFGTVESKLMQCLKKKVISRNLGNKSRDFWYKKD